MELHYQVNIIYLGEVQKILAYGDSVTHILLVKPTYNISMLDLVVQCSSQKRHHARSRIVLVQCACIFIIIALFKIPANRVRYEECGSTH